MSDETEATRLAEQRIDDLLRNAEQRGREKERVDGRLEALEAHKKLVNGQLVRLAEGQDKINKHLQTISETIAVAKGINEARLSHWQKIGLGVGALVGIATVVLLLIQTLHGLGH